MAAVEQLELLGEQNVLSAVQLLPLVTVWPPKSHVHVTVSPTWMVSELGEKAWAPLGATCTVNVFGPPVHAPLWHVAPEAQANEEPQPPQLAGSVCSLTHAPAHGLKPELQALPHVDPLHVAYPLVGPAGQAEHEVPHDEVDALLTQVPLQSWVVPAAHRHWPLWHVFPPVHAEPQAPQFELSLCSLTQAPLHELRPGLHAVPHDAPSHVACPPVGPEGQGAHDAPHVTVDVLLAQVPLQSWVVPAWQLHWLLWHVLPPVHA